MKGYEAARRGEGLALEPRPAGYHRIDLLDFVTSRDALPNGFGPQRDGWGVVQDGRQMDLPTMLGDFPTALFYVEVQAGTYIRAFARDLGEALGVPAHLSGLVRTRAGRCGLEQAVPLETLGEIPGLTMAEALSYPLVPLDDAEVARVRQGQRLALDAEGRLGLVTQSGELVAVAELTEGHMKLLRVWP